MKQLVALLFQLIYCTTFFSSSFAAESANPRTEWERTVEAAKKEGQLTLYHWGAPLMLDAGAFQKAFPEIKVTTISAMGSDLMQRILAERRGEKFIPDIYIAGIATMVVLHKAKSFDPIKNALILPEVADESKWWRGRHTYGDAERGHIFTFTKSPDYGSIAVNTKLVDPTEFKSYWDFLQPKWKSKIIVQDLRDRSRRTKSFRSLAGYSVNQGNPRRDRQVACYQLFVKRITHHEDREGYDI